MDTRTMHSIPSTTEAEPPTPSEADLARRFRDVMAGVATPVSVITAMADGVPHGTTVSAFASLSMRPPMVVACLDRDSDLLSIVATTRRFGVNILGSGHTELALTFARKGGATKFAGVGWTADHGLPRLPGTGWLACRVSELVQGGDHVLALGTVLAVDTHSGRPLTYHDRVFGTHTALQEPA